MKNQSQSNRPHNKSDQVWRDGGEMDFSVMAQVGKSKKQHQRNLLSGWWLLKPQHFT